MPTSAVGNKRAPGGGARGFTLIELLVVLAIMAIATVGVSLALPSSGTDTLQREGERLAAILESARAQSRASGLKVLWQPQTPGFVLLGLPDQTVQTWLRPGIRVQGQPPLWLGPEPLIGAQHITLTHPDYPGQAVRVATDGLRPFAATSTSAAEAAP